MPDLGWLTGGAQLVWRLPWFLRHPVNPDQAQVIVGRRLANREADFLSLMWRTVYAQPTSPYLHLLRLAGCEYGDLAGLVDREGLEGALHVIFRSGVYLTVEELKGRQPVTRGSSMITVQPVALRNPIAAFHLLTQSSGSRGARTQVPIDLANIRDRAVNACLFFKARGGSDWRYAIWGFPGGWPLNRLLQYSAHSYRGNPPERWFSPVSPTASGLSPRYRWSARILHWSSILARVPLPQAELVPLDRPFPIIDWITQVRKDGRTPHMHCFASWAVRICQSAQLAGIDLRGAHFLVGGEPLTPARLAVIEASGAAALPLYGTDETGGIVSHGCLAPQAPDDGHLYHDLHALVQVAPNDSATGLPSGAMLISSLRPTAPLILLNVSTGDRGTVSQRSCGCPMEQYGWRTHLQAIRSFEKLTIGGLTVLDADVIRILEELLPKQFGGGPTDYQLVDNGTADGSPRLRLLIHPAVGPVDTTMAMDVFLSAVGELPGGRMTSFLWREPGLLRIERREPHRTASGKIHHLHLTQTGT